MYVCMYLRVCERVYAYVNLTTKLGPNPGPKPLTLSLTLALTSARYVEHSNEVWNNMFPQGQFAQKEGNRLGLADDSCVSFSRCAGLRCVITLRHAHAHTPTHRCSNVAADLPPG